jgi:hypothetical protein
MNVARFSRASRPTPVTDLAAGLHRVIRGLGVLIATACMIAAGASPAAAATQRGAAGARAAAPAAACTTWSIDGSWSAKQSNTAIPLGMVFSQRGTAISGSVTFGSETGTIQGTLVGSALNVVISFPTNPGGPIKGRYTATVGSGSMTGKTFQIGNPSNHARWSAKGPSSHSRRRCGR